MDDIRIVESTHEHARSLSLIMRAEDQAEIWRLSRVDPEYALHTCVSLSSEAFTMLENDVPVVMFGVSPLDIFEGTACPWLLGSGRLWHHRRLLLRSTKQYCSRWLETYTELRNYTDATYCSSLRWLRWAGFELSDPIPLGPDGEAFVRITMRRS